MVLDLIDELYVGQDELKRLLLRHSMDVWQTALGVIERHRELGMEEQLVFEGCMAHDIGILLCRAEKILCFGEADYLMHGVIGGQLLREHGLERLAPFAERHTGVGLRAEDFTGRGLPAPTVPTQPVTMEEKLVAYADKFHSKSRPERVKSFEGVRKSLLKFGEEQAATFAEWHGIFE